jgi:hypothetical protein
MTGRERCDEIMRLIDEVLDSSALVPDRPTGRERRMVRQPTPTPGSGPRRRSGGAAER